ncbi:hypothetical protein PAHAL_5G294700 [Panicum hallii]|uniref:Uncharacterized protein n=1 Tax=Panicum hallii TaxID=206008 RepID=A0A2T8ILN7_9POAL|nr:hypothetical protein PAHAL_5G294700 [Panicum hallii]
MAGLGRGGRWSARCHGKLRRESMRGSCWSSTLYTNFAPLNQPARTLKHINGPKLTCAQDRHPWKNHAGGRTHPTSPPLPGPPQAPPTPPDVPPASSAPSAAGRRRLLLSLRPTSPPPRPPPPPPSPAPYVPASLPGRICTAAHRGRLAGPPFRRRRAGAA